MSHWSITEQTDHRLVAQATPRRAATPLTVRIIQAAVIISAYCPGIAALLSGSAILPATATCIASTTNVGTMDCQVSRNLWGRVIRRETNQLAEAPAPQLELQAPGDASMFYFGLCWLAGVTGTIAAIQLFRTRKTNWIFDNTAGTVQKQSISMVSKQLQTTDRQDIHNLYLEITDIDLDFPATPISLHFQLQTDEIVDRYTMWEKMRPELYAAPHQEFPEVLNNVMPSIGAVLHLPWQLVFAHQEQDGDKYYVFDFAARTVNQYCQGENTYSINFTEISRFEIEQPDNSTNTQQNLMQPHRPAVRYLKMIRQDGTSMSIHRYSGFWDEVAANIWFHQLQVALQSYFPEQLLTANHVRDCANNNDSNDLSSTNQEMEAKLAAISKN
jgi:hypothetical protein